MHIVYLGRSLWECTAVFLGYILRGRTAGPQNLDIHTASEGCCYHLLFDANSSFWILGSGTKTGGTPCHRVALGNAHTSTSPDRGDSSHCTLRSLQTNLPSGAQCLPLLVPLSCVGMVVCVCSRVYLPRCPCAEARGRPLVSAYALLFLVLLRWSIPD